MRKLLFSIAFLLLSVSFSYSQNGGVKGQVKDLITQETIIGAAVTVSANKGVATDFDGNFILKLDDGDYTLKVSVVGYKPIEKKISVKGSLITINFDVETIILTEVEVVADLAISRKTPVAFSTISPLKIQEQLGTQDLPMILNSTPGVYATQTGGGDGQARISIRGFNSQYVMVMLDGVPMNDIFNGRVFWSNWFGLDNQTKSVQVQRGLGASKLATPSVGGTMNILTSGMEVSRKTVIKQEIGNNNNIRTTLSVNSGKLKHDWAFSSAISYRTNEGWVDNLYSKMFFYYFKAEKKLGNHNLSLTAFGAPQISAQRPFSNNQQVWRYSTAEAAKLGVDTVGKTKQSYDRRYNPFWGYLRRTKDDANGAQQEIVNTALNQYHKPVITLKDFWTINDKFYISNILYTSNGKGYGTQTQNPVAILPNTQGELNIQSVYDGNAYNTIIQQDIPGKRISTNYIRSNHNDHTWYGGLSTFAYTPNNHLEISGGLDARTYTGIVYSKVNDLLGGDYIYSNFNSNEPKKTVKYLGDTMNQNIRRYINWGGAFAMAEYKGGWFTAFLNVSGTYTGYKQLNYFFDKTISVKNTAGTKDTTLNVGYEDTITYNNNTYTRNTPGLKYSQTDWKYYNGYTVKGGMNFNITEFQNVFFNVGYFSRPPLMTFVFNSSNAISQGVKNESIGSFEIGYSFKSRYFSTNINSYYTIWNNRPTTTTITGKSGDVYPTSAIGMGAIHKGIEADFAWIILKNLTFEGMISIGDWRWTNKATAIAFSEDGNPVDTVIFDPRGVKVGDAAQHTFAASMRYEPFKGFYLKPQFNYFSQNYSNFDPSSLVITDVVSGYGPNTGRQSWRLPDYALLDINAGYGFTRNKVKYDIRGSVMNVLDSFFISDATNNQFGSTFNANAATVNVGLGRRWVVSIAATF